MFRKLRKLKKDPKLFLYDAVRKRVPDALLDSQVNAGSNELTISADGFDVVNGLVVMSHPTVVEVMRRLKERNAKVTLSWR